MLSNNSARNLSTKLFSRRTARALLTLSLVASTLALTSPARAEVDDGDVDYKSRTGAECASNVPTAFYVGRGGHAQNNSTTQAIDITCPIGRDLTGTYYLELTMFLYKASGSGTMTCYLTLKDLMSSATRTISKSVSGSGYVQISFTQDGGTGVYYGYDTANVSCSVPKVVGTTPSGTTRSGIVGYDYSEHPVF